MIKVKKYKTPSHLKGVKFIKVMQGEQEKIYSYQPQVEKMVFEEEANSSVKFIAFLDENQQPLNIDLEKAKSYDYKTQETYAQSKEEPSKLTIFTALGQVEYFYDKKPFFYDKSQTFWFWNEELYKYERVDKTDLFNHLKKVISQIDTIKTKERAEIEEAFKQVGRLNIPEQPKNSWIQFKNTIIDIETREEFEASPKYFITNPIPYDIGKSEETPTIDRLFKEWVGEQYARTLYEIIAYTCSSNQFLQRIIALTGSGSNGKGTFLKLLTNFIGIENTTSTELSVLCKNNFETSALYKKLLCQMGEVDAGDLKNTNLIKKLTGEDLIRYEFKGKTAFSEPSSTTCIIATNSLPRTPDKSLGFYRRWLVVDFPNQFPINKGIIESIPLEEYSNLSKKVIRILKELGQRGDFTNGGNYEEREKRYEERSNPLQEFIESSCTEEAGVKVELREFTNQYNNYLKNKKLRVTTPREVGFLLREQGFQVGARKIKHPDNTETNAVYIINLSLLPEKTIKTIKTIEGQGQSPIGESTLGINSSNSSDSSQDFFKDKPTFWNSLIRKKWGEL